MQSVLKSGNGCSTTQTKVVREYVRLYGGDMHGQEVLVEDGQYNFRAFNRSFQRQRFPYRQPDTRPDLPMHRIDTYRIEVYNEESGEGYRRMKVGILEGRELFREEQCQLDHDMMKRKWRPKREPRFLYDFDRWYAWKMYEITGEFRHIREYVRW